MTPLVPILMFSWIPVVLLLFSMLPARRAVLAAYLTAWLFLPQAAYSFAGLPDYTRMSATTGGVFLAAMLFDMPRLTTFKFRWFDIPMGLFCVVPFFSSVTNGLGVYDGVSETLTQVITWGLPYLIGRLYFTDAQSIREFAVVIVIGGLIYMPLCWYELRMSPQLHNIVYGFYPHNWADVFRLGGWRPSVFMQHGLALALWMVLTSVVAMSLWASGAVRRLWGFNFGWFAAALCATAVLCKSSIATGWLVLALGALACMKWLKWHHVLLFLILAAPAYMVLRGTNIVTIDMIMGPVDANVEARAASLRNRLVSEGPFVKHAMQRPIFGWGGWGRGMPKVDGPINGFWIIPDALWTITISSRGLVGLVSLTLSMLLPAFLFWRRIPRGAWLTPAYGHALGLILMLIVSMLDFLLNAMLNPLVIVGLGAMTAYTATAPQMLPVKQRRTAAAGNATNATHASPAPDRRRPRTIDLAPDG